MKASMKLSKTNLKQLQRAGGNGNGNHPDKNYMLEKFLSQSNKSEVGPILIFKDITVVYDAV